MAVSMLALVVNLAMLKFVISEAPGDTDVYCKKISSIADYAETVKPLMDSFGYLSVLGDDGVWTAVDNDGDGHTVSLMYLCCSRRIWIVIVCVYVLCVCVVCIASLDIFCGNAIYLTTAVSSWSPAVVRLDPGLFCDNGDLNMEKIKKIKWIHVSFKG